MNGLTLENCQLLMKSDSTLKAEPLPNPTRFFSDEFENQSVVNIDTEMCAMLEDKNVFILSTILSKMLLYFTF